MNKTLESPYNVQVIDRALAILGVLGECQTDFSLAELCVLVKLHKSTVHRLLMVLGGIAWCKRVSRPDAIAWDSDSSSWAREPERLSICGNTPVLI